MGVSNKCHLVTTLTWRAPYWARSSADSHCSHCSHCGHFL